MWKNGFNVDDGVLRLYTDPQNREFLQSIERGEPPRELLREAEGGEVHLDMQDHREEEFVPPKPKYVLFNDGYKLGSPTPTVVSSATNPDDKEANEKAAKEQLAVDESAPVTQIQVRLSNGTRLVAKANQSHKIDDLRKFINRFVRIIHSYTNHIIINRILNIEDMIRSLRVIFLFMVNVNVGLDQSIRAARTRCSPLFPTARSPTSPRRSRRPTCSMR